MWLIFFFLFGFGFVFFFCFGLVEFGGVFFYLFVWVFLFNSGTFHALQVRAQADIHYNCIVSNVFTDRVLHLLSERNLLFHLWNFEIL